MKLKTPLKTFAMIAGLALSALPAAGAYAHTDVYVDLGVAVPPPPHVVVEAAPRYYPTPAYYYDGYAPRYYSSWHPHHYWRERDWDDHGWHDRGWHDRGWHHGWDGHDGHRRHDDD